MERDEDLRVRCFLALDALRAQYGSDLPFVGALSDGLATRWNQGTPAVAEYHCDYLLIVARPRQRRPATVELRRSTRGLFTNAAVITIFVIAIIIVAVLAFRALGNARKS